MFQKSKPHCWLFFFEIQQITCFSICESQNPSDCTFLKIFKRCKSICKKASFFCKLNVRLVSFFFKNKVSVKKHSVSKTVNQKQSFYDVRAGVRTCARQFHFETNKQKKNSKNFKKKSICGTCCEDPKSCYNIN